MKYTLLEITQKVLSSLDGDEVDSISDTVEAQQVVEIIQRCYDDLTSSIDIPEDNRLFTLDGTDPDTPIFMNRPSNIDSIYWIKYDTQTDADPVQNYKLVQYLDKEDFVSWMHQLRTDDDAVSSFSVTQDDGSEITYFYRTDEAPTYWTSFDDSLIVFNSIDSSVDANIQKSKSLGYARFKKTFEKTDSYIPALDDNLFPLLINSSIALAWAEMKQSVNQKVEKLIRDHRVSAQKRKQDAPRKRSYLDDLPNYGR